MIEAPPILDTMNKNMDVLWRGLIDKEVQIPELPIQLKDHIQAYRDNDLNAPAGEMYFTARQNQATQAGFQHLTPEQIVRLLTGDRKNKIKTKTWTKLVQLEWFYDHLYDKAVESYDFSATLYKPPFWSDAKWEPIYMVPLGYLRCMIPYGILLRISELKKLKFFNCFFAFAPESMVKTEMFHNAPKVDPVITACLSKNHFVRKRWSDHHEGVTISTNPNDYSHYFVGKW